MFSPERWLFKITVRALTHSIGISTIVGVVCIPERERLERERVSGEELPVGIMFKVTELEKNSERKGISIFTLA